MPKLTEVIKYRQQRAKKNLKKPEWWPENPYSKILKAGLNPVAMTMRLSNKMLVDERDKQILEALHDQGIKL